MREQKSEMAICCSNENGALTARGEVKPKLFEPKIFTEPLQELPMHLHVLPSQQDLLEESFFSAVF